MPDTPYLRENHHVPSVPSVPPAAYVMPKSPMEPPRVATRGYQTQQQHKSVWSDSTGTTTDPRSGASSDYRSTIAGSSEGGQQHTEILWLYEGERESANVGGGRKDGNGKENGTRLSAASSEVGSDYPAQPVSPLTPTEGRFFGGRDEETGPPPRRES